MSSPPPPAVVYLEADDEVTTVVRRVREADASRVIVVAPGRSRATSSVVALRLLARAGEEAEREVVVVGDALTRSLAAEAGLAAHGTLDDARAADAGAVPASVATHAPIRIMRGSDDTLARPTVAADEPTRPVPAARPRGPVSRPRRRRTAATAAIVALVGVLLVGFVAGTAVLPAATIDITPRSEAIGPAADVIAVGDVERLRGTVTETATVTATDTYEILEPATGTVVFFNWTSFDQPVAAGTLVAAGDQAFETQEDIVVPRGALTAQGTIAAGEESVVVVASAPGPAANVAAGAIDTVLNDGTDARLRGFQENQQRRVTNPDATSGGRDESGPEITEEDVQAASTALRETLREAADEAMAGADSLLFADPPDGIQPVIDGLDDLIGRRDSETVEIRGSLTYDRLTADPAAVEAIAIERFGADVPDGWELVEDATRVELGDVLRAGEGLSVEVTVSGRVLRTVERDAVLDLVIGRSAADAVAALEDLGRASVELWPGWVASVPEAEWRIEVRVASP